MMDQMPDPGSPGAHLTEPAVTASELPYWMSRNDHRGRLTELTQLAKDWARMPHLRDAMIVDPPRRLRWWHRFTPRRRDLARIAAVVHALCDRDGHPLPDWVWQHRSAKAIYIHCLPVEDGAYDHHTRRIAPEACAYHNVWFDPRDIEDIRVHGIRSLDRDSFNG
ncbi:MAG: hypothetical protein F4Z00_11155 [Acidimicrobiaceae bacterium]|nr:hypothetical protein [Acidimicrobiaceae bacterium]MXZ66086.1 hypothetical protein [Acidimicrobiaceae bacterium]MYF33023.1 hypothetical protein [Acidimicrobiaceae bacterium]MYG79678.1 hypothetical protein [Acidimicrobiaceae bacterium]MYJ28674.1 hypothetical protein [Acidimicrobiaceae bacterium]